MNVSSSRWHYTTDSNDPLLRSKSRVPGYLKTLADIMEGIPYWEMEPLNDIVSPNAEIVEGVPYRTNFALGKAGSTYLVYARLGGTITAKLPPGKYVVTSKQLVELPFAVPGLSEERTAIQITEPDEFRANLRAAYDWALVFQRTP